MTTPRPEPGPARRYNFPRFSRETLANGLELVVAPVSKLPVVTVRVVLSAGAEDDPEGLEGLAQLTSRALVEGTAKSSAMELTERLENLGATMESDADWDAAHVSLTCLAGKLPEAIGILGEILCLAAHPDAELSRLKDERLAEIEQRRSEPRGLANEAFARFLYKPGSRYRLPAGGTAESMRAVDRGHVVRHYEERYLPAVSSVVIAGDVRENEARTLVEDALVEWGEGRTPAVPEISTQTADARRVLIVTKEDAPQSELRIGHVGLPRSHPDYFAVSMMNAALGGLFNSRINLNLRERHGYTYSAHSIFDWRKAAGPFLVSTAVQTDVTANAVRETLSELERMRVEAPSEDELSLVRSYLQGVFPIRYESTAAIAAALANLIIYDLPDDYYDTYRNKIGEVTTSDLLRAAQAHLRPERLQVVIVGDSVKLRPELEVLALGAVQVAAPGEVP